MSAPDSSLPETLLRACAASDPGPWYPRDYAAANQLDRESLYGPLNDLRLANLVQLTEWQAGKGQGYSATPLGKEVLADPLFLSQLRAKKSVREFVPVPPAPVRTVATRFDRGEEARSAFYSPRRTMLVPILIAANIVMFLVSFIVAIRAGIPILRFLGGGDFLALHKLGAVTAGDLARGEWWRLVANCFLHFGLLHLTLNMFSLAILRRVEPLWGPGRYLLLYLTCGLCGSCAGVYYHPGDVRNIVYLAGASGALWGVMASAATWMLLNRSHLSPSDVRRWNQQIIFTLLLNIGVSMLPNVSAAAHFGGGFAGIVCALLLQMHRFGSGLHRSLAGVGLALLPTAYLFGLALAFDRDPRLQPFMVEEYRVQMDDRVGRLPAMLAEWEIEAARLHLLPNDKRDPARVEQVVAGLRSVVVRAREEQEWIRKSPPSTPTRALRERGQAMLERLIAYAEVLEKHATGEVVPELVERRASWQEARLAWQKLASPG